MDHLTNAAQRQADVIKKRRGTVSDLRFIAELVEEGMPAPIAIHPCLGSDGTRVQVRHEDLADWLLYFDRSLPHWVTDEFGGAHVSMRIDRGLTVVAFRPAVSEVCS